MSNNNPVEHAVNQIRHSMGNNYVNFKYARKRYVEYLTETRLLELLQVAKMGGIIRSAGLSVVVPKSSRGHVLTLEESRALEKNDDEQAEGSDPNSNQPEVPTSTSQQGPSLSLQAGPPMPIYVAQPAQQQLYYQVPVSMAVSVNGNTDPNAQVLVQPPVSSHPVLSDHVMEIIERSLSEEERLNNPYGFQGMYDCFDLLNIPTSHSQSGTRLPSVDTLAHVHREARNSSSTESLARKNTLNLDIPLSDEARGEEEPGQYIPNADTNAVYDCYSSNFGIYKQPAVSSANQNTSQGFEYINYADSSNSMPITSGATSLNNGQMNMNSAGQPGNSNNIPCSGLLHNLTSELFMELDPPGVSSTMTQPAVSGPYPMVPSNGFTEVQAQQGQQVQWDQENGQAQAQPYRLQHGGPSSDMFGSTRQETIQDQQAMQMESGVGVQGVGELAAVQTASASAPKSLSGGFASLSSAITGGMLCEEETGSPARWENENEVRMETDAVGTSVAQTEVPCTGGYSVITSQPLGVIPLESVRMEENQQQPVNIPGEAGVSELVQMGQEEDSAVRKEVDCPEKPIEPVAPLQREDATAAAAIDSDEWLFGLDGVCTKEAEGNLNIGRAASLEKSSSSDQRSRSLEFRSSSQASSANSFDFNWEETQWAAGAGSYNHMAEESLSLGQSANTSGWMSQNREQGHPSQPRLASGDHFDDLNLGPISPPAVTSAPFINGIVEEMTPIIASHVVEERAPISQIASEKVLSSEDGDGEVFSGVSACVTGLVNDTVCHDLSNCQVQLSRENVELHTAISACVIQLVSDTVNNLSSCQTKDVADRPPIKASETRESMEEDIGDGVKSTKSAQNLLHPEHIDVEIRTDVSNCVDNIVRNVVNTAECQSIAASSHIQSWEPIMDADEKIGEAGVGSVESIEECSSYSIELMETAVERERLLVDQEKEIVSDTQPISPSSLDSLNSLETSSTLSSHSECTQRTDVTDSTCSSSMDSVETAISLPISLAPSPDTLESDSPDMILVNRERDSCEEVGIPSEGNTLGGDAPNMILVDKEGDTYEEVVIPNEGNTLGVDAPKMILVDTEKDECEEVVIPNEGNMSGIDAPKIILVDKEGDTCEEVEIPNEGNTLGVDAPKMILVDRERDKCVEVVIPNAGNMVTVPTDSSSAMVFESATSPEPMDLADEEQGIQKTDKTQSSTSSTSIMETPAVKTCDLKCTADQLADSAFINQEEVYQEEVNEDDAYTTDKQLPKSASVTNEEGCCEALDEDDVYNTDETQSVHAPGELIDSSLAVACEMEVSEDKEDDDVTQASESSVGSLGSPLSSANDETTVPAVAMESTNQIDIGVAPNPNERSPLRASSLPPCSSSNNLNEGPPENYDVNQEILQEQQLIGSSDDNLLIVTDSPTSSEVGSPRVLDDISTENRNELVASNQIDEPRVDKDVSSRLCTGCGRSGSGDRADIAHSVPVPCSECGQHESDSSEGSLPKVRRKKKTKKRAKLTAEVAPSVVAPLASSLANGAHRGRRVSWADENGAPLAREKTISPRREVAEANIRRRNVLRRVVARERQSIGSAMRQMAADCDMGRWVERLGDEDEQEEGEEQLSPRYPRPITAKSIPLSARRRIEATGRMFDEELEDEPPLNEVDTSTNRANPGSFGHDSTACDCVVCQGLRKQTDRGKEKEKKRGRAKKRVPPTSRDQPSSYSSGNNGKSTRWDRDTSTSDSDIEIICEIIPPVRPSTLNPPVCPGSPMKKRRASTHDESPVNKRKRTPISQPAVNENDREEQPGPSGSNNGNEVRSERSCIVMRPFMVVAEEVDESPYTRVEVFHRPRLDEEFEKLAANKHVPLSDDESGDWEPIGTNGTLPTGGDTNGAAPIGQGGNGAAPMGAVIVTKGAVPVVDDLAPDAAHAAPEPEDVGAAPASSTRATRTRTAALKDGGGVITKDCIAGASRVVGTTPRKDAGDLPSSSGTQPSLLGTQPSLLGTQPAASDPVLKGPLKLELRPDMNVPHLMNDVNIHFAMENLAIVGPDPIATFYLDVTDKGAIVSRRERRKRRR